MTIDEQRPSADKQSQSHRPKTRGRRGSAVARATATRRCYNDAALATLVRELRTRRRVRIRED